VLTTFPSRGANAAAGTTRRAGAPAAATTLAATRLPVVPGLTGATRARVVRAIAAPPPPNLPAPTTLAPSASRCPRWLCPHAGTPAAFRNGRSAGWPRTACLLRPPVGTGGAISASSSPPPPSRLGSRPPGGKKREGIATTSRAAALANCSGSLARDAVADGPLGRRRGGDKRRYHRLAFRVLDHDPTPDAIRDFLQEFPGPRGPRGLNVLGRTPDGSSLYPAVLQALGPDVRPPAMRATSSRRSPRQSCPPGRNAARS
jgi:hypothetical protein